LKLNDESFLGVGCSQYVYSCCKALLCIVLQDVTSTNYKLCLETMPQVSKTKSELSPSPKLFNSSIYLVYFKVLVVNSCNCESGTNETN